MSKNLLFHCNNKTPTCLISTLKNPLQNPSKSHKIGDYVYNNIEISEDISVLVRLMRSRWFCIQEGILNNINVSIEDLQTSRVFINEVFRAIICNKDKVNKEDLCMFASSMVPIGNLNEAIIRKIVFSSQEPYYIYLHTLLELYYYTMLLYCDEKHLENVFKNLLHLYKVTVNFCNCMQHFWLSMQLLTEKSNDAKTFWKIFNEAFKNEPPLIALSLLKEMATIQRFNEEFEDIGAKCKRIQPNYCFLELKFKELLGEATSDSLATSFLLIEPLICNLWLKEGNLEIYFIIWSFYSRRLNVSNQDCQNLTALSFIESLDNVLLCPKNCKEDFEIFTGLMVFHLKEFPLHWTKMKGQIYSKLGPGKAKDLTEIGIRHVMVLYLALSSIRFEEIEKKVLSFLNGLSKEKKMTSLVWNMYAAVILKYVREDHSIENLAPTVLQLLQEASTNDNQLYLIKDFINNLEAIINNSSSMQLHQWKLFGSWLGKYQLTCYYQDLIQSLNVIELLLDKCKHPDSWPFWQEFFKDIVYTNLKQLALKPEAPVIIGKIAGKITINYNNLATKAFEFFNDATIAPNLTSLFLEVILDSYPDRLMLTQQQQNIIMQSWIKLCFLNVDSQRELTLNVIKLDIFPGELKLALKSNKEPMEVFIEYLGDTYAKQTTMQGKNDVIDLCELAFKNLSKTLGQHLTNPNEPIVMKIYKYSSLLFIKCGKLIYHPNKSETLLTDLLQVLLFPLDFVRGKRALHTYVLSAIKLYWSKFFQALMTLAQVKDPYLERMLKDLIINYLPQFPTSNSPIVHALEDVNMAPVILEKICLAYFTYPMKESDTPNLLKALKIVTDLANSTRSLQLFKTLVTKTFYGLCEVVIFHSLRSSAITVIKQITSSPLFCQVSQEFKQIISEVTAKTMGLNSTSYFDLMNYLSKFAPSEIKSVLGDVKSNIEKLERLKGHGFDGSLRSQFEKLEKSLK